MLEKFSEYYVSQELRERLHQLGFVKIIIAGKGNYVFTIDSQKWDASTWKKVWMLDEPKWGIDVPSYRTWGSSPTFGLLVLLFFRKSTTRSYYLMNFSQMALRGAEIWHIWKQHHVIECFWKIMKSIFQIRSMQLQGDGLYTALLIKVLAYLLAVRLQAQGVFFQIDHHPDHAQTEARGGFERLPGDAFSCLLFNHLSDFENFEQCRTISSGHGLRTANYGTYVYSCFVSLE